MDRHDTRSDSPDGFTDQEATSGARLTIDLNALKQNWQDLNARIGAAECAAAVKGNGYGIGLEQAVAALNRAGCQSFFVALPDEGLKARKIAPTADIFILGGLMRGSGPDLLAHDLIPVLGSIEEIREWQNLAQTYSRPLPAALHVDTGMNRLGLRESEVDDLLGTPNAMEGIDLRLLMSHLACASDPDHPLNRQQKIAFQHLRSLFPGTRASLANSAGIFLGSEFHHDLARPGISLYGGAALDAHVHDNPMRSIVKVDARILQIRNVPAGEGIGYGSAEIAKRDARVAIVAAGYADGFHRRAGSSDNNPGAFGIWSGRKVPIIGRVSMDLIAFDITECCAHNNSIDPGPQRGDWITLLGGAVSIGAVAGHAQTIDYELLTGLGSRYDRRYLEDIA